MNGHSSSLEAQTMQQPYEPSSELRLSTQGSVNKEVCIAYCSKSNDSEVSAATASQSLGFAFQPYMHV